MKYLLIILIYSYQGDSISTEKFENLKSCEKAKVEIIKLTSKEIGKAGGVMKISCLPIEGGGR